MEKIRLKELEQNSLNDLVFVQNLKKEYKKLTPLEALIALGSKEKIFKIRNGYLNKKELSELSVIEYSYTGEPDFYYQLTSKNGHSLNPELLGEILTEEWFVKL